MTQERYSDQRLDELRAITERLNPSRRSESSTHKQREQSARQLEDGLKAELNDTVGRILSLGSNDVSLIQRNFSAEVVHIIRASATSAYIVGLNYVGERKRRLHHVFLTVSDIEAIKKLVTECIHIFWRRVFAVLHQKDTVQNIFKSARFSHRSNLTLSVLITSLAVKIITKSIAIATVTKINALRNTPHGNILLAQVVEEMEWTTQQDERVCPLCERLDGMKWNSDDPNMLVPPDDSHDNCRCRLDVVLPDNETSNIEDQITEE